MICPKCHAEYLDHIIDCGDCFVKLVNACNINLPLPELSWEPLPPFEGRLYAEMATEMLEKEGIPYYLNMDWSYTAFSMGATNLKVQVVRVLVPKEQLRKAKKIINPIICKFESN